MAVKHGNLSINSENIFPIIKKWLYSDHDIFVRELVSNGCDAITKLKKLEVMGEYTFPEGYKPEIQVIVNPDEKTLKFIDNGIGMTADEVEKYITQIAFSGATQFLEKYKDKTTDDQMIGHFGLGFYSAFMVADEVHIDTLSYTEGAQPVHWSCDGGTEYDIQEGNKNTIGTEITLFLNEDCLEFANEYRMREILEKYCSFMPVHIYLSKANAPQEYETIDESELRDDDVVVEHIHEEAKTEEKENDKGEKEVVEISPAKDKVKINKRPVSISDINPLWMKHPNECTDDEYKEFYRKVFMDYKEPLFWILRNLNGSADYVNLSLSRNLCCNIHMHHSPICETFQSSQLHKCLLLHKLNIVCNYIHDVSHIYPSHHIYQAFHLHIHSTGENPNYEYERQIQSLEQLQFQLLLKVLK